MGPIREEEKFILAPLPFDESLPREKVSLWPGSKGIARKKHRREKNSTRRFPRTSAERGGPSGHPTSSFQPAMTIFLGERTDCPPGPENEGCLMIFARDALACGPGNAENSIHLMPTWRKVKEGKKIYENLLP
jgi:hypothetical protein